MEIVLLVVHMLLALALIGLVLIQRSEGGALGIGGGMSGFMTGRSTANLLTRTTAVLAALFFITSLALTWLSGTQPQERRSIVDQPSTSGPAVPGPGTGAPSGQQGTGGTAAPSAPSAPGAPSDSGAPSVPQR
ncbi:MAG TPA: preprotein translocase subunit SecG [Alphaproteobacteria bacterium]|jgi:preprotein translocase subunit SecG